MARPLTDSLIRLGLIGVCLIIANGGRLEAQVGPNSPSQAAIQPQAGQLIARLDVPIYPAVASSPDGRFLAVMQTRPDPILWIVPADGGDPFAFRKMWAAYKPRWAASGDRIGFIAAIGPPRIWTVEVDPASGRPLDPPRLLYRTPVNAFAFSPDGSRIAFVPRRTTAAGASEVHIVDWESRDVGVLLRDEGVIYRLDWAGDGQSLIYGLAPDLPADSPDRVMRADIFDGSTQTVLEVREFLGLSRDGQTLLYRPLDQEDRSVLELATVEGTRLSTLTLPKGATPTWGSRSNSLLQVRHGRAGDEIWTIPTPAR